MGASTVAGLAPGLVRNVQTLAQCAVERAGSQVKAHPLTTEIFGSTAARARTAVDLPVPRSPNTMTPPIVGSVAAIISASFISSWPTMAEKGNALRMGPVTTFSHSPYIAR